MLQYTSLDAILNYIPPAIKREEDTPQLLSWAFQAFKKSSLPWRYDYKACLAEINNHKVRLPKDIIKLNYVSFSTINPETLDSASLNVSELTLLPNSDCRLLIQQRIFFESEYYKNFVPLRFVGQSSELLNNNSINLYCKDCEIGFSVDKQLSCLTIDQKTGWLAIVYSTITKDENGNIQVPDDTDLLQSLALYAVAMHWYNRASSKEQNAFAMYQEAYSRSMALMRRARSKELFRNYNPSDHFKFMFTRQLFLQTPFWR